MTTENLSASPEMISFGNCPTCKSFVQVISEGEGVSYRTTDTPDDFDLQAAIASQFAMQDDIAAALRVLRLSDHARPKSPHLVMVEEVIPEISRLRNELAASRRDSARLDWLDSEMTGVRPPMMQLVAKLYLERDRHQWTNLSGTARDEIDEAMASDKASADECHKCFHKPEASAVCFCECHKRENSAGTNQGATKENR